MEYKHIVQYYETDKMGITHHSNYVRWMEEARVNFLDSVGCAYNKMEEEGIISPVVGVNLSYKNPTTFSDTVTINVSILEYTGIKVRFKYEMVKEDKKIACEAESLHCFVNASGRPINIKRTNPELHEKLLSLIQE